MRRPRANLASSGVRMDLDEIQADKLRIRVLARR
jgi:hypothetical protein